MKEGVYLQRLESLEKAFSGNSLTFGRQLAQLVARMGAYEELFATGPADTGFFKTRWLIFRNRLLTVLAPGVVGALLTSREKEIVASMKDLAEQRFLDDATDQMSKAKQPAPKKLMVERVEEPKKMKTLNIIALTLAVALGASACATKSQIKRYHEEAFNQANSQCMELQGRVQTYMGGLQVRMAQMEERLRSMNQLNDDGSLRYGERSKAKAEGSIQSAVIPAEVTTGGAK